jgi:hypothetical protein
MKGGAIRATFNSRASAPHTRLERDATAVSPVVRLPDCSQKLCLNDYVAQRQAGEHTPARVNPTQHGRMPLQGTVKPPRMRLTLLALQLPWTW